MNRIFAFAALLLVATPVAAQETIVPGRNQTWLRDGSATAPAGSYERDRDLGRFRRGADNEGFAAGGVLRWDYDTTRLSLASGYNLTVGGALTVAGVGPHAIGGSTFSQIGLRVLGAFAERHGTYFEQSVSPPAGVSSSAVVIQPTLVEASSGNHTLLASQQIAIATVTPGAATVTDTASLYIVGAMSATVTGANYALLVNAGISAFGSEIRPFTDLGASLGSSTRRWDDAYFSTGRVSSAVAVGTNPSTGGDWRARHGFDFQVRDSGNSTNYSVFGFGTIAPDAAHFGTPTAGSTRIRSTLATPTSLADGDWWVECVGTSPSRVCAIKVRDAGSTRTIGSVTY